VSGTSNTDDSSAASTKTSTPSSSIQTYAVELTHTGATYTMSVGVGSPATTYTLLVDIGSSNTWIGSNKAYTVTSTSTKTSDTVSVTTRVGSFSGTEYTDTVTLSSNLVINKQSIGVASTSQGFNGYDGVLGLGPTDLTIGTLSPNSNSLIPTITDNLFSQGTIPSNLFALYFEPVGSVPIANGEIAFGQPDTSKCTGPITYAPITSSSPANTYWGIDASISYGAPPSTTILSTTAGIVDSGTSIILIASDAFQRYQQATGGILDKVTGLLTITPNQYSNLQSLFFTIGSTTYEFPPNACIWPRSLNSDIGGSAGNIYLIIKDIGATSGHGLDFILGVKFLERFYSVYDTTNARVGFATTSFTSATSN